MPIKQVTCSICGAMVNKAVTYSVGKDQRACKIHEGVVEKRDAAEKARVEKLTAPPKPPPAPAWSEIPDSGMPPPTCWVCMNTGLRQTEFFLKVLVEMEKNKRIHGPTVNLFSAQGLFPTMKERCIFALPRERCEPAMKYVREDFQMLVSMGGVLSICGPCCGTFKIEALPKVGMEELKMGMALGEILRPAVEQAAAQELARDN